jgi:hypothetical protein
LAAGTPGKRRALKSFLIGAGAAMALSGLGLDTSVSLSTYGLYAGSYGPFVVIAGVPILLVVAFALALVKKDQKVMRYSMIGTGVVMSLVVGYQLYVSIFRVLIPGG